MFRSGYENTTWTANPLVLSNYYFTALLTETWVESYTTGVLQYKAEGKDMYILPVDLVFKWDPTFLAIAQQYASDQEVTKQEQSADLID